MELKFREEGSKPAAQQMNRACEHLGQELGKVEMGGGGGETDLRSAGGRRMGLLGGRAR